MAICSLVERKQPLASDAATLWSIADASGGPPGIDVAPVVIERAYGRAVGATFTLFAIGRTAGWLAHAIEQRSQASLIRPRARYVAAEDKPS